MEKISEKILYIVLECQNKQGLTTKYIAERVGCTIRCINYWKQGKRNISLQMAERILDILGYEIVIRKKQ